MLDDKSGALDELGPITDEDVIDLLSQLVSIKSTNPRDKQDVGPDDGEYRLGQFIAGWAERLGFQVRVQEVLPYRNNVLVTLEGRNPSRHLLFEGHMDTVQGEGMTIEPFTPRVAGDRLYGRGACDAKGPLASMMLAMKALRSVSGALDASVTLAAVVDEEHQFRGVSALVDSGIKADAAIVGEPTELDIVIAHKGCLRWRITTYGRSVHTSRAEEGVNAISKMAEVIRALDDLGKKYQARRHPRVGVPLLTVTMINGGVGVNTVPDRCTINVDRRTLPNEDPEEALREIEAVIEELKGRDPDLNVEMEAPYLWDIPMEVSPDEHIVLCLRSAAAACNRDSKVVGVPYGTDASKLVVRGGIPSVVFGPGSIQDAHTPDESISISQVREAAEILVLAATRF
ncbi:MAG TPA: M20 family metallopeptidase [Firmicutes bacterium]|nr:M20 family metallopeptidase [Bacillota bacterium]